MQIGIPVAVRRKAELAGLPDWVDALPQLVGTLASEWSFELGSSLGEGTEAFVAEVRTAAGEPAVLKVMLPRGNLERFEITALRLAAGNGCVRLLRADTERGAVLLERLGRSLSDLALPYERRLEILAELATRFWCPAPGAGLPTGAQKARALVSYVRAVWEQSGRPCPEAVIEHADACAANRAAAHDDARAVLVHGDVHQWNALESPAGGFVLVDPDGLLAEPEYDLGVLMREDPVELLRDGPRTRSRWLAERTGTDETAIWEWGVLERVSTGLLLRQIGMEPVGTQMLAAAEVAVSC